VVRLSVRRAFLALTPCDLHGGEICRTSIQLSSESSYTITITYSTVPTNSTQRKDMGVRPLTLPPFSTTFRAKPSRFARKQSFFGGTNEYSRIESGNETCVFHESWVKASRQRAPPHTNKRSQSGSHSTDR
jgi:hypothetical protein